MKLSNRLKVVLMIAIISLALVFLEKFKMPLDTFFWRSVFDFGHMPLFGIISIALLGLSQTLTSRRFSNPLIFYALAFLFTGMIGFLTEVIQYFTPRDADIWDIVNDVIGAICFLGFYLTIDRRVSVTNMALSNGLKYFVRLFVFLLGLAMITPTVRLVGVYTNRDISFPNICTFESPWEHNFAFAGNGLINIVPAPFNTEKSEINHAGQMLLNKFGHSSFLIEEPYPDWTGYDKFRFIIFSKQSENINLGFRINDRLHDNSYYDRFNKTITIVPGLNKIVFPITEIKKAPVSRLMDMRDIRSIILFTEHSMDSLDIYLDDFRLE